jgi:cell division protein FtsX
MPANPNRPRAHDPIGVLGFALLGLFLFSYPWLAPSLQARHAFGLPLTILFMMVVWLVLIGLVALRRGGG